MSPSTARVLGLTVLLAVAAAALAFAQRDLGPACESPLPTPWWLIAGAFLVTESVVIHLHIGRSAHSLSMTELPLVFGVFFLAPVAFLAARLLGAGMALAFIRRQRATKLAFNLSQFMLSSVVAISIVHVWAAPGAPFGAALWPAAFGVTFAENVVGVASVAAAISLAEGRNEARRIPTMLATGSIVAVTNTSLALLAIIVLASEPLAGLLLLIPLVTAFAAYRAYIAQRQQHESLEMLYESTRILQRGPALDRALVDLLDHARRMFRAEVAEISLLAPGGGGLVRTIVGPGDERRIMSSEAPPSDNELLSRCIEQKRALLSRSGRGDGPSPECGGHRNAIVAPLIGEARLMGALVVADRLSDISSFDRDDLRLLEAVANHTAVALENGQLEQSLDRLSRLQEELHHQAFHDLLTGLPNRALFTQSVQSGLESPDAPGRVPVVFFLDLDDFKLVNDSLGHASGDALLTAVGARIRSCLRGTDVAARLGGDEFGILLFDTPDLAGSQRVAQELTSSFDAPFVIDGETVTVRASIGVAASRGVEGADELLRNADVAMYAAKAAGKDRVVFFEPSMALAMTAQHELATSLQRAVGAQEFVLHFQPLVDAARGVVKGVEALVRWNHPVQGLVLPGEFIETAERSEVIVPLGRWVLTRGCEQMKAWQERWPGARGLTLNINVAGRQLAQPDFVDDTLEIIAASGLAPASVVLEVTEGSLLADAEASAQKLQRLRSAGVGVAIDDFGTGYSSLSHLQLFPVSQLKIPREFIEHEGADPEMWALAEAIVAMGRALGLDIVAEGVERPTQLERLRALGCQLVQGFYFARPLEAAQFEALLANSPDLLLDPARPGVATRLRRRPRPDAASRAANRIARSALAGAQTQQSEGPVRAGNDRYSRSIGLAVEPS